jgi:hypothetical protein
MKRYRVSGTVIASDFDVPELPSISEQAADWHVTWGEAPAGEPERWLQHFRLPDGPVWLSSGRTADRYLLRFPDLAEFQVGTSDGAIVCRSMNGTPVESVRHLLLDQVIPRLLRLRGLLALHAGAVRVPGGAAGFLGEAGQGKSTLVASFTHAGFALMSDDCLALTSNGEAGEALGSYPGIRLWPDVIPSLCGASPRLSPVAHYSNKRRLGPSADLAFCAGPVPLRRLYVLDVGEADEAVVDRMDPREATLELVTSTYRLGDESADDLEREFSILTRLVSRRVVRCLRVPQHLGRLPEARAAVLADLSDGA